MRGIEAPIPGRLGLNNVQSITATLDKQHVGASPALMYRLRIDETGPVVVFILEIASN
jgi:hypothetical protein